MQTATDFEKIEMRTKHQMGVNAKDRRAVLEYIRNMPFTYSSFALCQLWTEVSQGRDLSSYLEDWRGLRQATVLSKRFLVSYLLQNVDDQLREELVQKLMDQNQEEAAPASVPLLLPCQSLNDQIQKYKFNHYIESNMEESVGVLSFGFGFGSDFKKTGKSHFLNRLIFPLGDREVFETQDKNLFSMQ